MEYQTLKTKAIVLLKKDIGEADQLFTLYTENFGKIEVLGKGIRKIKAKLRGALQDLNYISLEFVQGKNFFIATDAILKNRFKTIKKEIKRYRFALYLCDLTNKFVKEEERDEKIWQLLLETTYNLQLTTYNLGLIVRYFEWNLLSLLGFEPELYHCVLCQERISQGKFYFSAKEGGVICNKCFQTKEKFSDRENKIISLPISQDAIKILRLIILKDKTILKRLKINSQQEKELKDLSKYYLSCVLEEEIFVV
ncbi:MAG TPA: DNA repair protein RecO [Candidatus Pacearchaeota archaeon]|nr:DNA repair protein RecO [Candidatus Pacearchaeota archaeon]HOK94077.1 DNA repair protein RecO [Candidatus Pacearchaeota archaeon]HPO75148.1 DNA repair protein RecO [Candidatus Pacearchaeota archaeon]